MKIKFQFLFEIFKIDKYGLKYVLLSQLVNYAFICLHTYIYIHNHAYIYMNINIYIYYIYMYIYICSYIIFIKTAYLQLYGIFKIS